MDKKLIKAFLKIQEQIDILNSLPEYKLMKSQLKSKDIDLELMESTIKNALKNYGDVENGQS